MKLCLMHTHTYTERQRNNDRSTYIHVLLYTDVFPSLFPERHYKQ